MYTNIKKLYLTVLICISTIVLLTSCDSGPLYLNVPSDYGKIQSKIEKLASGMQIDSLSIRSTDRKGLVSSIFIVGTDDKKDSEFKIAIEWLPQHKLTLDEISKVKKEALHAYKCDINTLVNSIEDAKKILPEGYAYKDVHGINYSATPFGQLYYFSLEVSNANPSIPNEYVTVFYERGQAKYHESDTSLEPKSMSDVYYVVQFRVENNIPIMLKAN